MREDGLRLGAAQDNTLYQFAGFSGDRQGGISGVAFLNLFELESCLDSGASYEEIIQPHDGDCALAVSAGVLRAPTSAHYAPLALRHEGHVNKSVVGYLLGRGLAWIWSNSGTLDLV